MQSKLASKKERIRVKGLRSSFADPHDKNQATIYNLSPIFFDDVCSWAEAALIDYVPILLYFLRKNVQ